MAGNETHGLGYDGVDEDPNVAILLSTMDATAKWEATIRLRACETQQLGQAQTPPRLLDVGCGLGDAALALVTALGPDGEVVGIDASGEMVSVAPQRARAVECRARFTVGDALALDEPADHFDVVRSERTLQWVQDPATAVAEMARVVRPGGLVSLIDTDWSTFALDVGDAALSRSIQESMREERRRPSNVGRRLAGLVTDAGLDVVAHTAATQRWNTWDPDGSPAPDGCFSMTSLADGLVEAGEIAADARDDVVSTIHDAARDDRFSMSLTMFAVVAIARPSG